MSKQDSDKFRLLDMAVKALRESVFEGRAACEITEELKKHEGFRKLHDDLTHLQQFVLVMANGDLSKDIYIKGYLAGALKTLQANLRHLTWQAQMIAEGDLTQRVEFMGDFSSAFNAMVESLAEIIGENKKVELGLRSSEENLRNLFESVPFPMIVTSFETGQILFVNKPAIEFYELDYQEVSTVKTTDLYIDSAARLQMLATLLGERQLNGFETQIRTRKTGQLKWALISARFTQFWEENCLISTHIDITERKQIEEDLTRLATIDEMTGIYNRRYFMQLAAKEWARACRYKRNIVVLVLDIDHFKLVNDTFGHPGGDQVLRTLAGSFSQMLRQQDIFGRIGGEEFAVLLPETGVDAALQVAERLRVALQQQTIQLEDGQTLSITISIGVAAAKDTDKNFGDILTRADKGLYLAKGSGRNCVKQYNDEAIA
ncbi:MAG: hypothetical protein K0R55_1109 [Sporomusa sp.]|jgi:diguanylate cyclase (GGDEF)-like protein/PAS domain S-box-containing protein|nr:hypothetical protein [Sporomusa sp.]